MVFLSPVMWIFTLNLQMTGLFNHWIKWFRLFDSNSNPFYPFFNERSADMDLSASLTALQAAIFIPQYVSLNAVVSFVSPSSNSPHHFLFSLLSGGVQDEENRSHQMGEAGGRGTGVQHQALQSPSVRTLLRSHMLPHALAIFLFFSLQRSIWTPAVGCSALKREWAAEPHWSLSLVWQ